MTIADALLSLTCILNMYCLRPGLLYAYFAVATKTTPQILSQRRFIYTARVISNPLQISQRFCCKFQTVYCHAISVVAAFFRISNGYLTRISD